MLRLSRPESAVLLDRLRGLITVLLFLHAKESLVLPHYLNGTVMLVVLVSATLIAVARWRHAADSVENNTPTCENRGTT